MSPIVPVAITQLGVALACVTLYLHWRWIQGLLHQLRTQDQVIESVADGTITIDRAGGICELSKSAERTFGLTTAEALGRNIRELIEPSTGIGGGNCGFAYLKVNHRLSGRCADGTVFPLSTRLYATKIGGRQGFLVVIRDDSRRQQLDAHLRKYVDQLTLAKAALESHNRQLEETVTQRTAELARAKAAAESANQAKSDFLANISHELRTPLHAVMSFSRFGLRRQKQVPLSKLVEYFQRIHECAQSLLRLINELLDLSKLEAGRVSLTVSSVNLSMLIKQVAAEFATLASERGLALNIALNDAPVDAQGDEDKLAQVVRNLLGNALKFSSPGTRIDVTLTPHDDQVVVTVADRGPGLPENEVESVFEKFVQSTRTSDGTGGTGLGLSICREIVELHRGSIWAANRPDGGAEFSFSLPIPPNGSGDQSLPADLAGRAYAAAASHVKTSQPWADALSEMVACPAGACDA